MSQDFAEFKSPGEKPILDNIFQVSDKFLGSLRLWLEQNPPAVQISSILGFSQFVSNAAADVLTQESTTSATFGDLATTGPTISGLPDGKYEIRFGVAAFTSVAGTGALVGVSVNGGGITAGEYAEHGATSATSVNRAVTKTLSNGGNNTLTLKYASGAGGTSVSFRNRWLTALRVANS